MAKNGRPGAPKPPTWRVRFLGAATALALVVAGLAALIAIKGNPTPHNVAFLPKRSASPTPAPHSSSAHPSPKASSSAPGVAQPSPSGTTGTPTPSASATKVPVTVLNNSTVSGLATRTADQIQAAGWPIAQIGNLQGATAVTTVYYAPGEQAAAEELAQEFPGIQDVQPRYSGLPGNDLTVVLTGDYQ